MCTVSASTQLCTLTNTNTLARTHAHIYIHTLTHAAGRSTISRASTSTTFLRTCALLQECLGLAKL